MKKIAVVVFALFLTVLNAAEKEIGLVLSTQNNPFFVSLKNGAKRKANDLGYKLVILDSQNDPSKELNNVQDLIVKKVDVILINPTDSDAVANAVKRANKAGIPVVTLDRSSNGGKVVSHVASDNVAGGEMAAKYIVSKLGKNFSIVELEGIPGASATRQRGEGFHKVIDAEKGIKVASKQTANFDRTQALNVMQNILQAHPNIDAVFAHNDEMALGASRAIKRSNKKIMIVGFDAIYGARVAIKKGAMAATVAQKPGVIGSTGVEIADKLIKGEKVKDYYPVNLELITK